VLGNIKARTSPKRPNQDLPVKIQNKIKLNEQVFAPIFDTNRNSFTRAERRAIEHFNGPWNIDRFQRRLGKCRRFDLFQFGIRFNWNRWKESAARETGRTKNPKRSWCTIEPLQIPPLMRSRGTNQQKTSVGHRKRITTGIGDNIASFLEAIAQSSLRCLDAPIVFPSGGISQRAHNRYEWESSQSLIMVSILVWFVIIAKNAWFHHEFCSNSSWSDETDRAVENLEPRTAWAIDFPLRALYHPWTHASTVLHQLAGRFFQFGTFKWAVETLKTFQSLRSHSSSLLPKMS
jgi:hypothetical protein